MPPEYCEHGNDVNLPCSQCEDARLIQRKLRIKREPKGPTDEELAEVYRSFGVEPPAPTPDPQWNQDQEDST